MGFFDTVERADRSCLSHLGSVDVTYAPSVGDPVVVQGLFDRPYDLLVEGAAEYGVEQRAPMVWIRLDDLPVDPNDDDPIVTIDGQDYEVIERKPDAERAAIVLVLHVVL